MQQEYIINLFLRDLDRLKENINSYEKEEIIWETDKDISNSAGHLCLHLCGNLQHYLGHVLLKTDYLRDRLYEFGGGPETKEQLLARIEQTKKVVSSFGERLTEEMLFEDYPMEVLGYPMNTGYFLMHLYGHLNYHMGQINYHKRLVGSFSEPI